MTDTHVVKEAEVVPETAIILKDNVEALVKDADKGIFKAMASMSTLDWRSLQPNQMALLLTLKPFVSSGGTMYLNYKQALLFAVRCFELNLSPFSSEVWYDVNRGSVNLTLEGKKQLLRNRGIDVGPPSFVEERREWKDAARMTEAGEAAKKAGFTADVGITCQMRVGDPKNQEKVSYTAWISEWYVSRSPVWQQKPIHMLTTRSCEKAISLILGTGASDMVGNEPEGK